MPIKQAIILAGGFGTRLREAVPDLPKCMAPVNGLPFLTYVIRHLLSQGIEKFIFSLGYQHEQIEEFLATSFPTIHYDCLVEKDPLGTGGAVKLACSRFSLDHHVVVANGDTLYKVDVQSLAAFHEEKNSVCTLALKPMQPVARYGTVEIEAENIITKFHEKKFHSSGLINGGMYVLHTQKFAAYPLPDKFSFEKDFLEKYYPEKIFTGAVRDDYFIDIGIPDDYHRAQRELKYRPPDLNAVDKSWTLFIDRDGVINHEKQGDYIRHRDEFRFYQGVKEALKKLAEKFGRIIVVSNQRGIGKELMTEADLSDIHQKMLEEITAAGGRIDTIYYCTATDTKHIDRKPNPGMAIQAKKDFPEIDFSRSIMIGNNASDMLFGRNAGLFTVFLKTTRPDQEIPHPDIDLAFDSLAEFANACLAEPRTP